MYLLFRQSSPLLSNIVKRAAEILYATVEDFGKQFFFSQKFLFYF
jgi:hypothetical protein